MPLDFINPPVPNSDQTSMLRHLPNLITVLRILLVVPLVWLIHQQRYPAALGIAAVAGFTDALDGYLAKRFGWQSWLGGILDPIADKLLLLASFISLGMVGQHPVWLTWLVAGRDMVIVLGALAYHQFIGRISPQPTWLSKFTTCAQIGYVLTQLLFLTHWLDLPSLVLVALFCMVVASTLVSGGDYVVRWSLKARREYRAQQLRKSI